MVAWYETRGSFGGIAAVYMVCDTSRVQYCKGLYYVPLVSFEVGHMVFRNSGAVRYGAGRLPQKCQNAVITIVIGIPGSLPLKSELFACNIYPRAVRMRSLTR